jgi:hypothetical protein
MFSIWFYDADIQLITTASVPILKLKMDTSQPFLNPSYGVWYQKFNYPHRAGIVEVDLTIETDNKHLGVRTTEMIK